MGCPLTLVPLVEFKSLRRKSPFFRVILACIKEIEESSIRIVLPFILPMVIVSSFKTWDTGGKPGNWMLRVGMIELGLVLIPYQTCVFGQSLCGRQSGPSFPTCGHFNLFNATSCLILRPLPKDDLPKKPTRNKARNEPSDAAK
jgi:hypothetical protein